MIDIITGPANHGHMIAESKNAMNMIDNSIVYGYDVKDGANKPYRY